MARTFYLELADALRGFLPSALRSFESSAGARNLKVWYDSTDEHYEVQLISRAALSAAGIQGASEAMEIGFHAEHSLAGDNDTLLEHFAAREKSWRRALGDDPVAGPFVGRRELSRRWRRISELWDGPNLEGDEAMVEAADRLAAYIRTFEPLRRARERTPRAKGARERTPRAKGTA